VRFEKEVVPSFRRDIKEYAFEFGWTQKIAPRIGASYDLLGDGRMKLFGSYNLMYNWIPYELSRGTFGGDVWRTYYRSLDTLDVLSLGNGNVPGNNLWNGTFEDHRIPSFGSSQVDPNIKPMSDTLVNAGFEYQIRPSTVVAVRYSMNHLREAIEDIGTLDAQGSEVYIYGNPERESQKSHCRSMGCRFRGRALFATTTVLSSALAGASQIAGSVQPAIHGADCTATTPV